MRKQWEKKHDLICVSCGNGFKGIRTNVKYCSEKCKHRVQSRRRYTEYPEKTRDRTLRRLYGITTEQYDQIFEQQEGKCPVCLRHQDVFSKRLAVDHDHVTGEVRGLLCDFCNSRFIGRHRSGEYFHRAADYLLKNHTGWFVPDRKKRRRKKKK